MADLNVEVLENGLRVTEPGTHFAVTYLRNPASQSLECHELLALPEIDSSEASFLAAAWKAAFAKAKDLGWL